MSQNEALKKARELLGPDAEVGRTRDNDRNRRFVVASRSRNLCIRGPSFTAILAMLEAQGVPADPEAPKLSLPAEDVP